jgi:hypothetical protein
VAQQSIDLKRYFNEPLVTRLLPGGHKCLLPIASCLVIAFFFLASFFPKHHPFEVTAVLFLALSVLAGVQHATSIPTAVPLLFEDVVHVMLGTLAAQLAIRSGGLAAVEAAPLVAALAWLSGRLSLLDPRVLPASVYCGAFAGMTASHVLPTTGWVTLAGILAGILYSLARHFWVGIGGKLGTLAFAATAVTVVVAHFSGWSQQGTAPPSINASLPWQLAIVGIAIVCVPFTYWLSEHRKLGAVCASAVPTAVFGLGINLLGAPWHSKMLPLVAAWLGSSFAGMTSMERLAGRHWMLPMIGLICGLMLVGAGPRLHGFGGLLGTNALVSVLAGLGIARLLAAITLSFAKQARSASPSAAPAGQ